MNSKQTYEINELLNETIKKLIYEVFTEVLSESSIHRTSDFFLKCPDSININEILFLVENDLQQLIRIKLSKALLHGNRINPLHNLSVTQKRSTKNIGWLLNEKKLQLFYDLLVLNAFINAKECGFEIFRLHFYSISQFEGKIKWYGQANELTYLFISELINGKRIIPYPKSMYKLLCEHFCKPDGKNFTPVDLRRNHGRGIANKTRLDNLCGIAYKIINSQYMD